MKNLSWFCVVFGFCFYPIFAVDKDIWSQADLLMKRKDYKAAFKLSESIIEKNPEDVFGWQLRMNSSSQLAETKGQWPRECVSSALKFSEINKTEEISSITTAIWCLNHENQYTKMVELIPKVIPHARTKVGDGNYALLINVLAVAFDRLNDQKNARSILMRGLSELSGTPAALQTGYNLGDLFRDETMSLEERENWHKLFSENLFKEKKDHPLFPSIAWNTSLLTDLYVSKKKYHDAFEVISLLYPEMDAQLLGHWKFLRDQIYIKYLALKFKTKRLKIPPRKTLKMVFLVIPKTRLKGDLPSQVAKFQNLDSDLNPKDVSDLLLSFEYFRDSFEDLSNGIHWDHEVLQTNSEIQNTNCIDDRFRFVMQPSIGSIVPQLTEDQLKTIRAADGVIVVWAGTRQPDGVLITNGGGTEWNYGTEVEPDVRLTILSDSNKKIASGNHANHPIFIYHELFHVLEWAYHQLKFPKDNHPYQRRKVWPYDYQGETEWDFYSETFQKRMMKEDNLDRVYWQGRKEGFYGILMKEQGKSK
ncbi:tetratricopeptide repeat protein [Leptospira meyeri]|uniref:hypothetical protein n=1 Tax=Leptospira meyeri TaxID=29508 RepID=UPI00223DFD1D|nr:hypothetical protein [Leptospira meyeri]MCW7489472.1 hypothetical protein [Leptospira meyeri]